MSTILQLKKKQPPKHYLQGTTMNLTVDFSSETVEARKQKNDIFKLLRAYFRIPFIQKKNFFFFLKAGKCLHCVRSQDSDYFSRGNAWDTGNTLFFIWVLIT